MCDPWCLVDPCGGTCDYETNICVLYNLDVDAGPDGDGGVITAHPVCRPRPSECVGELMNCGGPAPDPTCGPPTGPCLNALTCWPVRIALRGNYLSCK